eukprot:4289703-Alexandrium_andersonii.AAC.1
MAESAKMARRGAVQLDLDGAPVRKPAPEGPGALPPLGLLVATGEVECSPRALAWATGGRAA